MEIREGMKSEEICKWIEDLGQSAFNLNWNESVYLADTILRHLHEEGVRIVSQPQGDLTGCVIVKVEPLIEEGE